MAGREAGFLSAVMCTLAYPSERNRYSHKGICARMLFNKKTPEELAFCTNVERKQSQLNIAPNWIYLHTVYLHSCALSTIKRRCHLDVRKCSTFPYK